MNLQKLISLFLVFLIMNLEVHAASILGKVAVYTGPSKSEIVPLISGNKMSYQHKTLVRINGGTLVADAGTVFEALDEGDRITFKIERGSLYLRVAPEKGRVAVRTPLGDVTSPAVALASNSVVSGEVIVSGKQTTIEVSEGTLELTPSRNGVSVVKFNEGKSERVAPRGGVIKISEGDRIVVAQAGLDEVAGADLSGLINQTGVAVGSLNPSGSVQVGDKTYSAAVVNKNLKVVKANLPSGTAVRVIGARDLLLLVVPIEAAAGEVFGLGNAALIPFYVGGILACFLPRKGRLFGIIACDDDDDDEEASPIRR
ncbi:MAG: hypothetical protein ACT4NX_00390 [Deltaproteobacteria bacterium]